MTSFSLSFSHHLALPLILSSPHCSMSHVSLALRVFSHVLMTGEKGGEKEKKLGGIREIYCSEGSQAPPVRPLNVGWRSSGTNGSKNAV